MRIGDYGFATDDEQRGRAALVLYAMYKSRDANSPLMGKDTWNRFGAYMRSAVMKSTNMAEFVQQFSKLAKIGSIRPGYLTTGPVELSDGSLIQTADTRDFKTYVFEDDTLLPLMERESQYLMMLVRERIQREKLEHTQEDETDAL